VLFRSEHQGYPMAVIYNPDGTFTHSAAYTGIASFIEGNNASDLNNTVLRNTAGVIIKPVNGLTLKGDFTYSRTWEDEERTNNYINYSNSPGVIDRFGHSLLRQLSERKKYLDGNITANYLDLYDVIRYNVAYLT